MPKGKRLSEYEKGKIDGLKEEGWSNRKIAEEIGRSRCVIDNYINLRENYGQKKSSGRKRKLTRRDERAVVRLAIKKKFGSRRILASLDVNCSRTTNYNTLKNNKNLKFAKMKRKPPLKQVHKDARLKYANEHMSWTSEWQNVIFADEKKFNLDGPDGYRCYWHGLRRQKDVFSKRIQGGGSVMAWAAFGWFGRTTIVFCDGRMNSEKYTRMLDEELLPISRNLGGENWIFQ